MLRAPRIKAFTTEKNKTEVQNNTTVNVSYPGVIDPIPEMKTVATEPMPEEKTREVVIEQNTRTEKILKLMLEAYKSNPLHINDYIVLEADKLAELIQELTEADEIQLQISADITCCGSASRTQYLDGIVVKKGDKLTDFKIGFNEEWNFLNNYRISTDFIINSNDSARVR